MVVQSLIWNLGNVLIVELLFFHCSLLVYVIDSNDPLLQLHYRQQHASGTGMAVMQWRIPLTAGKQAAKNTITLKGSTEIVTEFFGYSINSILYQVRHLLTSVEGRADSWDREEFILLKALQRSTSMACR